MVKITQDEVFRQQLLQVVAALVVVLISSFAVVIYRMVRQPDLKKFLTREEQKAALVDRIELSHDTLLLRFLLPRNHVLGLPTGQHIKIFLPNPASSDAKVKGEWNGRPDAEFGKDEIERKYTPTSSDRDQEHFDLVVKVYKPNERFCDGGKASQYLDSLQIGDELSFSGPWGTIEYKAHGEFHKNRKPLARSRRVAMVAGGSGVTPMLQVIEQVLATETTAADDDAVTLHLLFANQTEEDILLRDRLEELVQLHPARFQVHYTVDRPPAQGWKYSAGFITKPMLQAELPKVHDEETMVLLCGPPPMIKMLKEQLGELGCAAERILEF